MANELSRYGSGIRKNSARPVSIHVGDNGEYWLCDAGTEAGSDYDASGCMGHSSVPMAEGG